MADNRRVSNRHNVDLPCALSDGETTIETHITNLSLGGAFVASHRLAMGRRIHVSFRVPTHENPIENGALVRWSTDHGIGIQFDGLRAKDVWALTRYFDTL